MDNIAFMAMKFSENTALLWEDRGDGGDGGRGLEEGMEEEYQELRHLVGIFCSI